MRQRENFDINEVFLKDFHFYQFHVTEFFPRPKIHVMLDPLYVIFLILITYRKVASTSPSCLEAHAGFFRLSLKAGLSEDILKWHSRSLSLSAELLITFL